MIPYSRQNIGKDDIDAVVNVMKSDFLTQGPITPIFEEKLTDYCGASYAVASVNATAALHLACMSLDIGAGDIVWTSTISFVASANCAKYCGAEIDLVDIDPISYNMSIESLTSKLKLAKKKNRLPKAVIPVHLSGQSCNMKEIKNLSVEYGFKIIEDASHAFGAKYLNTKIGSCKYSDITVFSFHPVKIITSAEGGVCMTNDKDIYKKIYDLRSHGIVRNQSSSKKNQGPWYYEQIDLGYNYRLNDLQAALGINQVKKVDLFVKQRNEVAEKYNELLKLNKNITIPKQSKDSYSSFHLYIIKTSNIGKYNRFNLFERLRSEGFYVNVHYIPIYHHPYYSKSFDKNDFPNSEEYYSKAISIPIYPGLQEKEIQRVVATIEKDMNFQNLF